MDNPSPDRSLLHNWLLEIDEARNARPRAAQQPSEIVKERDARHASQAEKITALRRAREAGLTLPLSTDVSMPKRELIDTATDKRYVRRNKRGQFNESDDVGRSLAADRRRHAKTKVRAGYGDKGDQPRRTTKAKRKAASKTAGRKGATRKPTKARAKGR
jgi:hypothetical protein